MSVDASDSDSDSVAMSYDWNAMSYDYEYPYTKEMEDNLEKNLEWAKECKRTEQQPWKVVERPRIEEWGVKEGVTIADVQSFFNSYPQFTWKPGTILVHTNFRKTAERFDQNTYFRWDKTCCCAYDEDTDKWTNIDTFYAYLSDKRFPPTRSRAIVLTRPVKAFYCYGWEDRYFTGFFGANDWEPAEGPREAHDRAAEWRGNQAMYELGYEGKWHEFEKEIHLTQPLACGVEVSIEDLRNYLYVRQKQTRKKRQRLSAKSFYILLV